MDTIPYFTRIDRYFAVRFLWCFVLCVFISGSLFLAFDFVPKLDDMPKLFQEHGALGALELLAKYYTIHISHIFRLIGGIPILLGAAQALYMMERASNLTTRGGEVIPILTSGFSRWRVAIPFLYTGFFLVVCMTLLNEWFLPGCHGWPGANSNDYKTEVQAAFAQRDLLTGVEIQGAALNLQQMYIRQPRFVVALARRNLTISAGTAQWQPKTDARPSGYLLTEVDHFEELRKTLLAEPVTVHVRGVSVAESASAAAPAVKEKLILLTEDHPWIPADAVFFRTEIMPSGLYKQANSYVPISLADLRRKIEAPSVDPQYDLRVEMHKRILQPFLDMSLLMMCLPIILSGRFRSKLLISAIIVGVSCLYLAIPAFCALLGREGAVTPLVAAWIPLFIFYSVAALLFEEYYT